MLLQDLRYGFRILVKDPGFTVIAVLTLALGIGANTAIFSLVNAALLRPLPYPQAERIVHLSLQTRSGQEYSVTAGQFLFWRDQSKAFEAVAAYAYDSYFNLWTGTEPISVKGLHVSEDFFRTLGVAPAAGRGFLPEEDRTGAPGVVILSHNLWQRSFSGGGDVIGRSIQLNGKDYTVVGIMPQGFQFTPASDLWLPLLPAYASDPGENFEMLARTKPGMSLQDAQADAALVFTRFRAEFPKDIDPQVLGMRPVPYQTWLGGDVRRSLLLLLGVVAIVLLIAGANVVNLMLTRMPARRTEIALRAALGATGPRLAGQLVTESLLLALLGGVAGLIVAPWTRDAVLALSPQQSALVPLAAHVPLDRTVFGFSLALSVVAGTVIGLIPAIQISRLDLNRCLKQGDRTWFAKGHHHTRSAVVVTEVALSIVLLAGAVLLIRSLSELHSVRLGFEPRNLWTVQMSLPAEKYRTTAQVWSFESRLLDRLKALPGVVSAATVSNLPMERGQRIPVKVDALRYQVMEQRAVSPGYFLTMHTPLRAGRPFGESDAEGSAPVAIVNEALVRLYLPDRNPIGETILIGRGSWAEPPRRIVGVAADSILNRLNELVPPAVFVPQSQVLDPITQYTNQVFLAACVIRSAASLDFRTVQRAIQEVDPRQAIVYMRTAAQVQADSISSARFYTALVSTFAVLALLLAAIGIYGVISCSVTQRTQEIGVRIALGAKREEMLFLIVRQGLRLALIGTGIGLAAGLGLTKLLSSMLYGVRPTDPMTFVLVPLLACAVALVASFLPALHATKLDAAAALRNE